MSTEEGWVAHLVGSSVPYVLQEVAAGPSLGLIPSPCPEHTQNRVPATAAGEREGEEGSDGEGKFKTVRTGVVARPKDKILTMDPKEIT